jgi:ribose/xylose/arabinose/galactoside ABC-type transport system permease subunit
VARLLSSPLRRTETGLLLAVLVVLVLTGLLDPQHTYFTNARGSAIDILRPTARLGIFALGAAIVIIAGGIDLSSGSVIAFSGSICATLMLLLAPEAMETGRPVGPAVIAAAIAGTLVVGLLIGSLHAWLITVIGLPPFVATLATLVGLRSLGRAVVEFVTEQALSTHAASSQIQVNARDFRYLGTSEWIPALTFAVVAGLCCLLMSRTVAGRHLHALGGNEQAARLSGIQTDRLKWLAYCLSAVLSSLVGIFYIGDQAVADPQTLGRGYELNAIAAAVVGGCSLAGGVGTMPGTVLGTLFLVTVIDSVAKLIKRSADVYEGLIVGTVVVLAVALTQLRQAGRQGKQFFPGPLGLVTILNLALLAGVLAALFGREFVPDRVAVPGLPGPPTVNGGLLLFLATALVTLAVLALVRFLEGRGRRKDADGAAGGPGGVPKA